MRMHENRAQALAVFLAMLAVMAAFAMFMPMIKVLVPAAAVMSMSMLMLMLMIMLMIMLMSRFIQFQRITAYPAHGGAVRALGMREFIPAAKPYLCKKGSIPGCVHKAGVAEYLHAHALAVLLDIADKRHIAGHLNVLWADAEIVLLELAKTVFAACGVVFLYVDKQNKRFFHFTVTYIRSV